MVQATTAIAKAPIGHPSAEPAASVPVLMNEKECPICLWDIGTCEDCAAIDAEAKAAGRLHPSWFWYGRWEGAQGGYVPPAKLLPSLLYRIGNCVGRRFGPPPQASPPSDDR